MFFVLLYLILQPRKPAVPPAPSSIPSKSSPADNPFVGSLKNLTISPAALNLSIPPNTVLLSVTPEIIDLPKIAQLLNIAAQPQTLPTDTGTKTTYVQDQTVLTYDARNIAYSHSFPSSIQTRVSLDVINASAQNQTALLFSSENLELSPPIFYYSSSLDSPAQITDNYESSTLITYTLSRKINGLTVFSDSGTDNSLGQISYRPDGELVSFNLTTNKFTPTDQVVPLAQPQKITGLVQKNQFEVINIRQTNGNRIPEEDYSPKDFSSINIISAELGYFYPSISSPQNIFPFYILRAVAKTPSGDSFELGLAVSALLN